MINFLGELYLGGLGYSAINSARSALSTFITVEGMPAGQHELVKKFMRGVFNLRPALPKYTNIWDVDVVLKLMRKWAPVKYLTLKKLTFKLLTLLLLLTGQRGQAIHTLELKNIVVKKSKVMINFTQVLKTTRPGHHQSPIAISGYAPDRRLCIVTVLTEYLKRTRRLRKDTDRLLISTIAPHGGVSRDTISRWLRLTLKEAGIDTSIFAPHSTRSAATSKASRNYVPSDIIIKAAGWASDSTFRRYYKKPVTHDTQFSQAVLLENK